MLTALSPAYILALFIASADVALHPGGVRFSLPHSTPYISRVTPVPAKHIKCMPSVDIPYGHMDRVLLPTNQRIKM
ncbi:hypothetical protein C8R47DRAFT_581361 [Mycena vitilis]|nr:hypothetical protein C8R47DRAFT_581361 [Mycena vitilis]